MLVSQRDLQFSMTIYFIVSMVIYKMQENFPITQQRHSNELCRGLM